MCRYPGPGRNPPDMLSIPDMAILGAAALIFFGPEQLPKVARKAGLFMRDVQNTSQSFIREMERAADEHGSGGDVSRAHLLEDPIPHASNGVPAGAAPSYEPPVDHAPSVPVDDGQHAAPVGDDYGVPKITAGPLAGHEPTP
jgi:Sec-independent protein translocase protein TatA